MACFEPELKKQINRNKNLDLVITVFTHGPEIRGFIIGYVQLIINSYPFD